MPSRIPPCVVFLLMLAAPAFSQADSSRSSDSLTSGGTFRGTTLRRLPIDEPRQAFTLLPGVVLRTGEIGIAVAPDISIRGGLAGQASTYIDGAPVRFQTFGTQGIGLGANGIAEVAVTSGIAPASIADASGGLIRYVTRTGSERLAAQFRWDSDEPFGDAVTVGYNRLEASVGGPLPLTPNLSFFFSATLQGQLGRYRGAGAASFPTYVPAGVDTVVPGNLEQVTIPLFDEWTRLRRPMDWSSARRLQSKVQYAYGGEGGGGGTLSLTWLNSDLQQRSFPGQMIMDPGLYSGVHARSAIAIVNWRHSLGALRGGPIALAANLSIGSDDQISGPLTAASDAGTRDPTLGIELETLHFTGTDVVPLPVSDRLVRNIRTNSGLRVPYLGRSDLANIQRYRTNAYGIASNWPTSGIDAVVNYVSERRLQGRWNLEWQPAPQHLVILGVDAGHTSASFYRAAMLSTTDLNAFLEHPARFGVFAGDRVELGRAVLDLGVRYDHLSPGGEFAKVPGRIFTHPTWLPASDTSDTQYASSVDRVFSKTRGRSALSPRVRLAYAVSPKTRVRLAYGRTLEPPSWATYFQLVNADIATTNIGNAVFGRDVQFATSSQIDAGVRSALGSDMTVDVAVYRKSLPRYVGRREPFPDPANVGSTITLGVIRLDEEPYGVGLDARVEGRVTDWLSGSAAYSVLSAHVDDSSGNVTTQAVAAMALVRSRIVSAQVTLRAVSGVPYQLLPNTGLGGIISSSPLGITTGASRFPWTKRIDVRITKAMRAGGRDWTLYADVRNLLDFRNIRALFNETGDVTNLQHRTASLAPEFANLHAEASGGGALAPDGTTVDLSGCGSWNNPVNCVALTRVERRFGDGDGVYTLAEQQRVANAYYDAVEGPWFFYGSGRTLRIGLELEL